MTNRTSIIKGDFGETLVAEYLTKEGFTVIQKNFIKPCGEIDIIAYKDKLLVFVEVKLRYATHIDPGELVNKRKQAKIITTARYFLHEHNDIFDDCVCRFDVALVTYYNNIPDVTYIPNAFYYHE